jgi:hypothetical protein
MKVSRKSEDVLAVCQMANTHNSIIQITHYRRSNRATNKIEPLIRGIDKKFSGKVFVTAGGLVEIAISEKKPFEECNRIVAAFCLSMNNLKLSNKWVLGIDLIYTEKAYGQYVVHNFDGTFRYSNKRFPLGAELRHVVGFPTKEVLCNNEFIYKNNLFLVCHDAQIFNHRTQANVRKGEGQTLRGSVMDCVIEQARKNNVRYAFNVVHAIEKSLSYLTFRNSYNAMCRDLPSNPIAIGSFGFSKETREYVFDLCEKMKSENAPETGVIVLDIKEK